MLNRSAARCGSVAGAAFRRHLSLSSLRGSEREAALSSIPSWTATDAAKLTAGSRDEISRTFKFGDFVAAFQFMTAAALHAEKRAHHPEWSNVYDTVKVTLSTHDAGGLTSKDIDMAKFMDERAKRLLR